jgi:hypothetical protein
MILFPGLAALLVATPAPVRVTQGFLYYNGTVTRTVVVPAPTPNGGRDPLYTVTNGVQGQLGVAATAPGAPDYHGGQWAVYLVTFQAGVTPVLLTSEAGILEAEAMGLVTITRDPAMDFRCPIQP